MKIANRWLRFGAIVAVLIQGHASLRAQPANEDAPAPAPSGGEPAPVPIADESAPVPTADEPASPPPTNDPTPAPTTGAPIMVGAGAPWSQGASAEGCQTASERFDEGNRLFKIPIFAKAAEQYAAALAKCEHPAINFNLALAQLNMGKELEARANLERALRYGAAPLGAEQFEEAQKQLQALERQLARIRVTCLTPGAEIALDGVTLFHGLGTHQQWVEAKDHEITAKKAGYLSEARRVTTSAGELQEVNLRLITLEEATQTTRRWARWKPWAAITAGGVLAVAGGALHALAYRSFQTYDEDFQKLDCAKGVLPPGCPEAELPSGLSARLGRARQMQTLATGGYIVGGSLVAAGIVLLYLNQPRLAERAVGISNVALAPAIPSTSNDMLGIQVSVNH